MTYADRGPGRHLGELTDRLLRLERRLNRVREARLVVRDLAEGHALAWAIDTLTQSHGNDARKVAAGNAVRLFRLAAIPLETLKPLTETETTHDLQVQQGSAANRG